MEPLRYEDFRPIFDVGMMSSEIAGLRALVQRCQEYSWDSERGLVTHRDSFDAGEAQAKTGSFS